MISRFSSLFFCVVMVLSIVARPVHADMPFTNHVWFEATGVNGASHVIVQGAQEVDLELSCDTSSGPVSCEWNIAMRMHSTQQFGSIAADLVGNTEKHSINNLMHGGEFPSDGHLYAEVNDAGTLISLKEVNIPIAPGPVFDPTDGGPGDYLLATMTLHTSKTQGDLSTDTISATINNLLWVSIQNDTPDEPTFIMFGNGPALDGEVQGGLADCIHIHNVPEPATAAMTFVAAGLILPWCRRRR